jgi:hypothetical protein
MRLNGLGYWPTSSHLTLFRQTPSLIAAEEGLLSETLHERQRAFSLDMA